MGRFEIILEQSKMFFQGYINDIFEILPSKDLSLGVHSSSQQQSQKSTVTSHVQSVAVTFVTVASS